MKITYYKGKVNALKKLESVGNNYIIANRGFTKYFLIESYCELLSLIQTSEIKDFYEFIPSDTPLNFFLDIEIYKDKSEYFENFSELLNEVTSRFCNLFNEYNVHKIILESHNETKRSFHIIFRLYKDNNLFVFKNVKLCKHIYHTLYLDSFVDTQGKSVIDSSVYREGLFRTIFSSKSGENRPLIQSDISDPFELIESFVCCLSESGNYTILDNEHISSDNKFNDNTTSIYPTLSEDIITISEEDQFTIKEFINQEYHHFPNKIREIIIDKEFNCIVIALNERYCQFVNREHKSNNQYIVIDTYSSKQKCHDTDCREHKFKEIKLENYPNTIHDIIKRYLKVNQKELELIEKAKLECKTYITENFDSDIQDVSFDKNEMVFRGNVSNNSMFKITGKCINCKLEHHITNIGYCLKCSVCQMIFPKNQLIPIDDKFSNLNNFWMNYTQLVNHGTINNIVNIYQNGEEDFSCDIKLDKSVVRDKKLLGILNECLDGHKITKMAELMNHLYKDYIYTGSDWFYFNDTKWSSDIKSLNFKKDILELCKVFNKIRKHYEEKAFDNTTSSIVKNIKSLNIKLNKPQLKDDILKESQLFYMDSSFFSKLNSKKHLVPFENGVFDLLANEFRKTKKEDYINLSVNYNYSLEVNNSEVHKFIEQTLPNKPVRDYILKKMSECLNGDIPNTNFLMFIGDGANGKSQLLNLMKLTIGELGEKVEVTLLTRKRNNANEANTEKIKLMNKRFAFLSEPEDGEKINIGLLKELTGSEEIVARGLYQESMSFVMEAKLFLACNELPEIKGEDTALWRRIRVIDFPSRFVDEPKESNEFKIDRTLPSRMREDITWRQTFMNILLSYYPKQISEPDEVKIKTNEYRQENDKVFSWFEENIIYKEGSKISLKDLCLLYFDSRKIGVKEKGKLKKEIESCIKKKFQNVDFNCIKTTIEKESFQGWFNLDFRDS
jgi:P4 family phage/plasmid primase-like protien